MDTLRILILFVISVTIFQACQKKPDELDSNCGTRLKMVSTLEKERHTTYFQSFFYDGTGRLANFVDSIWFRTDTKDYTGFAWPIRDIEYDQQGKIIGMTQRNLGFDNRELWYYNSENLVVKKVSLHFLLRDTVIHFYTYDGEKRLVIDSLYDSENKSLVSYTTFLYDARNNVIESNRYTNASGVLRNDLKVETVYDDHPNPFYTIGLFTIKGDFSGLSRNNIVKVTTSNGTTVQYEYRYCGNGLPKSAVITIVSGQITTQNIEYEYE